MRVLFLLLIIIFTSGCGGDRVVNEATDGWSEFFSKQESCLDYVADLIVPAAESMSSSSSIEEMRTWIDKNPEDEFSVVVMSVRRKVKGVIDPVQNEDRHMVMMAFFDVLKKRPGFKISFCDFDAWELAADIFYQVMAERGSVIVSDLIKMNVYYGWDQKLFLLSSIMASEVEPSSVARPVAPEGRPCNLPAYKRKVNLAETRVLRRGKFELPRELLDSKDGYACALVIFDIADDGSAVFVKPVVLYPSDLILEHVERAISEYEFKRSDVPEEMIIQSLIFEFNFDG